MDHVGFASVIPKREPCQIRTRFLCLDTVIVEITHFCHSFQELIPLILCGVFLHENGDMRDLLLHSLFNLIKKPDKEQR